MHVRWVAAVRRLTLLVFLLALILVLQHLLDELVQGQIL